MMRRCISEMCLVEAMAKSVTLDLPVATILESPRNEWFRIASIGGKRSITARAVEVDWQKFTKNDYLFTHSTIVASVKVDKNGYYIDPVCSDLVNNNGNAWSNEVLLATFRSFVGGDVFLEHVQVPELSKGKILDAVLRPVKYKNAEGKTADVFYVDILNATHRQHTDLVGKIASGELSTLSMGCICPIVQCSRCGVELGDNDPNCEHLNSQIFSTFVDEKGIQRRIAELCGRSYLKDGKRIGDPDSVRFIEASWVEKPAFEGAVLNHYIGEVLDAENVLSFPTTKLEETVEDLFRLRVADRRGMLVLRLAREELMRRKREALVDRVAKWAN